MHGGHAIKFILSDLDGTLIDSVPTLAYCIDQMQRQLGLPPRGEKKVRTWIGDGVDSLIKRALTDGFNVEPPANLMTQATEIFFALYEKHLCWRTTIFDGVCSALTNLQQKNYALGCITNKPRQFTTPLLEKIGLASYFSVVVCGDDLPAKKPSLIPLQHAAITLGWDTTQGVMAGDSQADMQAARAAGMVAVCVRYGYLRETDNTGLGADYLVDTLIDLELLLHKAA